MNTTYQVPAGTNTSANTDSPESEHADQVAMLQVLTAPTEPAAGYTAIVATQKQTKEMKAAGLTVPASERYRAIHIKTLEVEGVPSKFHQLVLDALYGIAKAQLTSLWEADRMVREVPAALWGIDSLLAFSNKEKESSRLSADTIATWFDASNMAARILAKTDAATVADYKEGFSVFAAPILRASQKQLIAYAAMIRADDDDAESTIGAQILARIDRATSKVEKEREAL